MYGTVVDVCFFFKKKKTTLFPTTMGPISSIGWITKPWGPTCTTLGASANHDPVEVQDLMDPRLVKHPKTMR